MEDVLFSDLIQINPKVELKKGDVYPFVEMGEVEPGKRYVYGRQLRSFSGGGAKFKTGDILFARITPCLENGKIAQFNSTGKTGFGSTEFFVFRAIHGIADPGYVYYLSMSDIIKQPAIKSMSGASGRQRADLESTTNTQVPYNPLPNQRKIAAILSAYDDMIENNLRCIKILEEMAQLIYREWFVHFRFPRYEKVKIVDSPLGKIPEGWEVSSLGEHLIMLESGKRPKGGIQDISEGIPSIGAENINGIGKHNYQSEKYVSLDFFDSMNKGKVRDRDVGLYKDGAYIGKSTYFRDGFPHDVCCINEHVFLLRVNGRTMTQNQLYLWLQEPSTVSAVRSTNANAAQPGINQKGVRGLRVIAAPESVISEFDSLIEPYLALVISLSKRNLILCQTRDLLLPKLISGELDVSELDITLPEEVSA